MAASFAIETATVYLPSNDLIPESLPALTTCNFAFGCVLSSLWRTT